MDKYTERIIESGIQLDKENWKIILICNRNGENKIVEELEERLESIKKDKIIVAGDFNARTANKGTVL